MKTRILQFTMLIALLASSLVVIGQSTTNNNLPGNGKFLGYDAGGVDLNFRTNNINRMRLMQTGTNTIDQYTVNTSGNLVLSSDPIFLNSGYRPFSLLHLNGQGNSGGPQPWGYRPWMRDGITFTHNSDFMYVGPMKKGSGVDKKDAVIA